MNKHTIKNTFSAFGTVALLLTACHKSDGTTGNAGKLPVADFNFTIGANTTVPVSVSFTSTSKYATTWSWDFGDGSTATTASPQHTYQAGGTVKVKLVVSNEFGKDSVMKELGIAGGDQSPLVWQEHWLEHTQALKRVYVNSNVVVYYDDDVNRNVKWPFDFFTKVWQYTKSVYGEFGSNIGKDDRLYVVLHTDKYGGGHPASYIDDSHDNRNTIDLGAAGGSSAWMDMSGWNISASVHEVGHIVEGASYSVKESPAFDLWGDSKWAEIFVYDVFKGLNMDSDAQVVYDECMHVSDTYPVAGSQWFRDWFYPIYSNYGGSKVLAKFFNLLSLHFPKSKLGDVYQYNRRMNMGEFIHFYSAAAGVNLQPLAAKAFGWSSDWTTQLTTAKSSFSAITYSGIGDALVVPDPDVNITTTATLQAGAENSGGANASEGSSQLVDGSLDTKYTGAFASPATFTFQLPNAAAVNSYTIGSNDGDQSSDPKEWEFQGSNDNSNWTTLDTQTTQLFINRKQFRRFRFDNAATYSYYRLVVNANRGSSNLQLSELGIWKTK